MIFQVWPISGGGYEVTLQQTRSQLTINVVKLTEVDNKIKYEEDKLEEMKKGSQYTDEMLDRVSKRIEDLKIERQITT